MLRYKEIKNMLTAEVAKLNGNVGCLRAGNSVKNWIRPKLLWAKRLMN
jgi:hypothetical protein